MTQRVYPMTAPGLGPSLQDWLEGEGILEEVDAAAMVRVAELRGALPSVLPGVGHQSN